MSEPSKAARDARSRLFSSLCTCGEKLGWSKSGAMCFICTGQEIQRAIDSAISAERERCAEIVAPYYDIYGASAADEIRALRRA